MASIAEEAPLPELSAPLAALWWDAKGDWTRAHAQVDDLESRMVWPSTPLAPQGG